MRNLNTNFLAIILFIGIMAVGFTNCSKQKSEPQNNVELSFILEQSGSSASNFTTFDSIENIMRTIDAAIRLDPDGSTAVGCKVRITTIGTSIRPKVYTVILAPGKSWMETTDKSRKEAIQRFRKQVLSVVQHIMNTPATQQRSQVYLTMCQELNALSRSNFGTNKTLYILSDGLQSDGTIEFIDHADNLERFKNAFPEYKKQMMQQCALPDLSNINIIMSNSPNHVLGAFILTCDQFWRELIQEHKGNLIIKGSITS